MLDLWHVVLGAAAVFAGGVLGGYTRWILMREIHNPLASTFATNIAAAAPDCAAATETAEKVVKPPRNPVPHSGPGLNRPMAKQPAMFTAKVSASAAAVPGAAP